MCWLCACLALLPLLCVPFPYPLTMTLLEPDHPIVLESFACIDAEIGAHSFTAPEYAIVQRVIHTTADFELKDLLVFSPRAIDRGLSALKNQTPIITDVAMVRQGIQRLVRQSFGNPLVAAIDYGDPPAPQQTRTETGMNHCIHRYPQGIYAIGNAPTALLALCRAMEEGRAAPALVIGVPVGFVAVREAKAALAQVPVAQIRIEGRKGGSAIAAAIINALIRLAAASSP